nr:hypothetical protein [Enterococcus casseliflavus]
MTLIVTFTFLKKIKNRRSLYYIYLIYFNLLFFCVKKKPVFPVVCRIKQSEKTVYTVRKNCLYSQKKLFIQSEKN